MTPPTLDPDLELAAAKYLLTEDFPHADQDERETILAEAGYRLRLLADFLLSDSAYAPRWPEGEIAYQRGLCHGFERALQGMELGDSIEVLNARANEMQRERERIVKGEDQ